MKTARFVLAALLCFGLASACGSSRGQSTTRGSKLVVFAAASLTRALPKLDSGNQYEFGGSNTLALQIEQGAPADVFVSASPKYVTRLQSEGLVFGKPAWFATNTLILIVPKSNPAHIRRARDLSKPGVRLVVAAPGVPAGDYARKALASMHLDAALNNVVSNEPDVEGVLAKVASGDADAGFVYATDAKAVGKQVRKVPLPRSGNEVAVYGAVALKNAAHLQDARGFVALLLSPPGQALLKQAGFGPQRKQPRS
jgi:molybdate transport system substrate-binding protein